MLHTDYYSASPFWGSNYSLFQYHLMKSAGKEVKPVEDFRFNENVKYQGFGNGTFMRLNACTSLRVLMWVINPDSPSIKKRICYPILMPLSVAFDLVTNVVLIIAKLVSIPLISIGKMFQKIADPTTNLELGKFLRFSSKNVWYHIVEEFLPSLIKVGYHLSLGFVTNILGPEYDLYELFFKNSWGYYLIKKIDGREQQAIFLDYGRVDYLRKKCGWEKVTNKKLENYFTHWALKKRVVEKNGALAKQRRLSERRIEQIELKTSGDRSSIRVSTRFANLIEKSISQKNIHESQ